MAIAASDPAGTPALRVERHFRAAPQRIFHAWTTAEELSLWSDPDPTKSEVEVDLRVGGRYRIAMSRPNGVKFSVTGVYREIDPPRRLVYTWQWENMPGFPETTVTVEFRARADGGTDLVLLHEGLPGEDSFARHQHGWTESIVKLDALTKSGATATQRA